jgi:hypothetical protein
MSCRACAPTHGRGEDAVMGRVWRLEHRVIWLARTGRGLRQGVETSDEVRVEAKRGGGCSEEREERSERIGRVKRAESRAGRVESRREWWVGHDDPLRAESSQTGYGLRSKTGALRR